MAMTTRQSMFEVEQKFAVESFDAIEQQLHERGVELSPPIAQADRYFAHPSRDFATTDEALRIRQIEGENRITYKGPKLDQLTKTRREIELPLAGGTDHAEGCGELLVALGFSPRAVIRKQRRVGDFEHRESRAIWRTAHRARFFAQSDCAKAAAHRALDVSRLSRRGGAR
jgi:predicted adenylyl cyclase CyaB